jgi:hypothetical protein
MYSKWAYCQWHLSDCEKLHLVCTLYDRQLVWHSVYPVWHSAFKANILNKWMSFHQNQGNPMNIALYCNALTFTRWQALPLVSYFISRVYEWSGIKYLCPWYTAAQTKWCTLSVWAMKETSLCYGLVKVHVKIKKIQLT